jgi:O-antigen ligase
MSKMSILKPNKNLFYFLLTLILLRPSLDIFSQKEFQIHPTLPEFNLNIIIGGLVFLICIIFFLKNFKFIYSTPLFYPVFFFLGLSLASVFYSLEPLSSIKEFIRIASIFLLYFLAYKLVKDRKDWFLLLKIILISYILPAIFALIQFVFHLGLPDEFGGFQRIYGTFAHPNPFAFYTFFILGLILCLLFSRRETTRQLAKSDQTVPPEKNLNFYLWLAAGLLTFLLLVTYSRSALACFFVFILFFGLFKYRKLLLLGLILFLVIYFFSDVFQQRFWELITLDPYGSVVWRLRLWQDIAPISLWQPWFGYGLGTFTNLVEFYRGFEWGSLEAHNDYLKILVENGIFGLVAYFWLIIALLFYLFRIIKKSFRQEKIFSLGILIIVLSLFLASFFDNILRGTALQWNLWILLAGWLKIKGV